MGPESQIQVIRHGSSTQLSHLTAPGFILHMQAIGPWKAQEMNVLPYFIFESGGVFYFTKKYRKGKVQAGDVGNLGESFPNMDLSPNVA